MTSNERFLTVVSGNAVDNSAVDRQETDKTTTERRNGIEQ